MYEKNKFETLTPEYKTMLIGSDNQWRRYQNTEEQSLDNINKVNDNESQKLLIGNQYESDLFKF